MIRLTRTPLDVTTLLAAFEAAAPFSGAIVSFCGKVRPAQAGDKVQRLQLQAYSPMTEQGIAQTVALARDRWPLEAVTVAHRIGDIQPLETIVFVATASAHRRAAFEATDFLMDYLKTEAFFWKKEITEAGERWIEPRLVDYSDYARWKA